MATHSNILAWRISWTEEPGELQYMSSQRVGHNWMTNTFWKATWWFVTKLNIFLPWNSIIIFFYILLVALLITTKLESNQDVFDKETLVHPGHGIVFTAKKKWVRKLARDMEYSWMHITKWKKLIWKGYILHESNYKTFHKKKNVEWNNPWFPAVKVRGLMNRWSQKIFRAYSTFIYYTGSTCHYTSV